MSEIHPDPEGRWIQYLRRTDQTKKSWACIYCSEKRIYYSIIDLRVHVEVQHSNKIPSHTDEFQQSPGALESQSRYLLRSIDDARVEKSIHNEAEIQSISPSLDLQPPTYIAPQNEETSTNRSSTMTERISETSTVSASPLPPEKEERLNSTLYTSNMENSSLIQHQQQPQHRPTQAEEDEIYKMILQPTTKPISQEQLVTEVKGIYAGLVMVEAKCIEVDNKQAKLVKGAPTQPRLNNEQWQALIALHRTLLHEHHDFFLASQHPSASPSLRILASKYAMPARMWRHGIQSFLELLRGRLPASHDHMLAFIYLAYSMVTILYETVPAFEVTWIECLGDLGRYRMVIEDEDIRDGEIWNGVARHWYSKASDKAPTTGRLYHHIAVLARPNALQQLCYYGKSLCVVVPFNLARESILTLFDPVLHAENGYGQYRLPPLETTFIRAHGHLFTNRAIERFEPAVQEFLALLDNQIGRVTRKFQEQGCHIAISNNVAMLGFASKDNPLMIAITPASKEADVDMDESRDEPSPSMIAFRHAQNLNYSTLEIVLKRIGDPNVLPFIHVSLVFLFCMSQSSGAMNLLAPAFPWKSLAVMLNTLLRFYKSLDRIENDKFPLAEKDDIHPFPEDFEMRGLLWSENYFPENWFLNMKTDEEEGHHELAFMLEQRKERILWLACRIADAGPWISFDSSRPEFCVQDSDAELEDMPFDTMAAADPLF
ncbi:hypothetical protein BHYA_0321g00010 [Botrytis hyacinthi]|uniref:DNA/RNA-binding domain-containing protein n=1 Tax=Botrytis hyacinthi TaxID=278943 RepID=A0A4Z1G5V5_9HELO|nr:hypothetical protein BHYA_0321g00010 [Botrytis hyacinthi]